MVANAMQFALDDYPDLKRVDGFKTQKISMTTDEMVEQGTFQREQKMVKKGNDHANDSNMESEGSEAEDDVDDDGDHGDDFHNGLAVKAGMADAMSKILGSSIGVKPGQSSEVAPILAKSKTMNEVEESKADRAARKAEEQRKKAEANADHITTLDDAYLASHEAKLKKIATRGVVLLFNAVRKRQKELNGESSAETPSAGKKEFLDMLKTSGSKDGNNSSTAPEDSKDGQGGWAVVQDGYMTKGKAKDWEDDAEDEEEAANMAAAGLDSEDSDF